MKGATGFVPSWRVRGTLREEVAVEPDVTPFWRGSRITRRSSRQRWMAERLCHRPGHQCADPHCRECRAAAHAALPRTPQRRVDALLARAARRGWRDQDRPLDEGRTVPVGAVSSREPAPEPDDSPRRFGHPAEAPTPPVALAIQALLQNPWEALAREAREAREAHEAPIVPVHVDDAVVADGDLAGAYLRAAGRLTWAAGRARADLAFGAVRAVHGARSVRAARAWAARSRWRRWAVEIRRLRFLRKLTRALTSFLRRRGGGLRWSPQSRLPAEDSEREDELPLFLRKAFLRWRARARFAQSLGARRRRTAVVRRPRVTPRSARARRGRT